MMLLFMVVILAQAFNACAAFDSNKKSIISYSFKDVPFVVKDCKITSLKTIADKGEFSFVLSPTVYVNGQAVNENPLIDKEIKIFELIKDDQSLLVTKEDPSSLFHITSGLSSHSFNVSRLDGIRDAGNKSRGPLETSGIIGLSFGASGTQVDIQRDYFFAAVKGHDSDFGQIGGGIALLRLDYELGTQVVRNEKTKKDEEQPYIKRMIFNPLDAHNGHSNSNCAYPIDNRPGSDNKLTINNGLSALVPNVIEMHWNPFVRRLYIAVQLSTTSGARSDQGACALLVGRMVGDSLRIESFAPHDLLSQMHDTPISAMGSSKKVSLHKIRSFKTSTGTLYLIGIGGLGEPEETKNNVFALPLVDRTQTNTFAEWSEDPEVGTLANFETVMTKAYGFAHTKTCKDAESFPSLCTAVGGGKSLPGQIVDIEIVGDSVWVSVQGADQTSSGIFESHPIFNERGVIELWTTWKRSLPQHQIPLSFHYSHQYRVFQFVNADENGNFSCQKTGWFPARDTHIPGEMQTSVTWAHQLVETFSPAMGGVQALEFFDHCSPGIAFEDDKAGLVVATGYQKVFLGLNDHFQNYQNVIFQNNNVLNELGPISASTFVCDANATWLVVAGMKGLAVLCDENGNGIRSKSFEDFIIQAESGRFLWKKIGQCRGIQKLISGTGCLFAVTRKSIERIEWCVEAVRDNALYSNTVFDAKELTKGTITDAHIVRMGAIVGTTAGLFSTAQNLSLDAERNQKIFWHPVEGMEKESISKLFIVQNSFKDEKQQVYALAGSLVDARSYVYRLYFSNGNLQLVPYKKDQTFLLNCKGYRRTLCVEGSRLILTKAMARGYPSFLQEHQLLPPGYRLELNQINNTYVAAAGPYWTDLDYAVHNSITGHFIVCGNGGIYVRE